jgi:hypothetical protein
MVTIPGFQRHVDGVDDLAIDCHFERDLFGGEFLEYASFNPTDWEKKR